ncbi:lytic transglycosylase domain-containing protein [Sphingomonas paucimobilis]|uniref:lytic transglycosylase domain-containing protein n=1 Tax=Sphingomonas paucimobilis TaxID=13689 RepID=UPI0028D206C3|nr:lytic transglycosylase domain-containing protein [Sphingomonas paucimobilis]
MTVQPVSQSRIQSAIALASSRTGVDFGYLLGQAKLESGLNANARAGTSSASGLYQFVEQSWLAVLKKHGAEHGLGWAADSIGQSGGRYYVSGGARAAVMGLRNDPTAASLMAAEHASDNKAALESTLGRETNGTDLYMAHFLGLGGATKFLSKLASSPQTTGAALFPAAARANRSVFYAANGQPRTVADIYDRFANKLAGSSADSDATRAANMQFAAQALALQGQGDATVVTGNNESASDALAWATSTMNQLGLRGSATANATGDSLLRPKPDHARLAYMMLASMGG